MKVEEFFEAVRDKLELLDRYDRDDREDVSFFINDMEELFNEWNKEI